jgi:hypothetical protein
MRFIDDDDVIVAVEDLNRERYVYLVGQLPVEIDNRTRPQRRRGIDGNTGRIDYLARRYLGCDIGTEPAIQLLQDISALQPQPSRTNSVSHR